MANYVVNLERLISLNIMVDVDDPAQAVDAAKELYDAGEIDWTEAHIDQTAACCLATGSGEFQVIGQKEEEATEEVVEA